MSDEEVNAYFKSVIGTLNSIDRQSITRLADMLMETYEQEGTVFLFGNGGSGANAAHFCGDLLKDVSLGLEKRFKAICLNDNIPALMAIANDISYEDIFVEQLKNFVKKGDLVIGFSGSGNSKNVVKAMEHAKQAGATTVAICGFRGGKIKELAHHAVHAAVEDMEASEDTHLFITHCVKKLLVRRLRKTF